MAETEPTEEQQRQIWNLVAAIGQDPALRERGAVTSQPSRAS